MYALAQTLAGPAEVGQTPLRRLAAPIYAPLVFGKDGAARIPVLMIVCLSALARPFASTTSQMLKAIGRPQVELRWRIGLTAVLVLALAAAAQFSSLAVAFVVLVAETTFSAPSRWSSPACCRRAPRTPGAARAPNRRRRRRPTC